jgi:hypothetical protein
VSLAVLFAGVGSVDPPGSATVAVFVNDPVALAAIVPLTVNVAVPLGNSVTKALIEPEPEAGHVDPADAVQVHVTLESDAGIVSATVAPTMVDGPEFDATIV